MTQIASSPAAPAQPTAPPPGLTAGPPAAAPAAPAATTPAAGAPSSAAEASTQQTQPADPRAGIDELARAHGYDPSQLASFPDLASATSAIRMATENAIRTHYAGPSTRIAPAYPQQQPQYAPPVQQPQPTPTGIVDLKALGLEDDEPVAKALRALEGRVVAAEQSALAANASLAQQQKAALEQNRSALRAQAAQVVDSFADPAYGTSKARTAAQQINLSRLYDLADMVAQAEFNAGNPIPPLNVRIHRARLLDSSTGVGLPAPNPGPAPATLGALPQSAPPPVDALPQMKITDKWSQNPQLVAMVR